MGSVRIRTFLFQTKARIEKALLARSNGSHGEVRRHTDVGHRTQSRNNQNFI